MTNKANYVILYTERGREKPSRKKEDKTMMYARAKNNLTVASKQWTKVDRLGKAWYPSGMCEVAYINGREYKTRDLEIIIVAE